VGRCKPLGIDVELGLCSADGPAIDRGRDGVSELDFGKRDAGEATFRGIVRGAGESLVGNRDVGVAAPVGRLSLAGVPAFSAIESEDARAVIVGGTPDFAIVIVAFRLASISFAEDDMPSMMDCRLEEPPCICNKLWACQLSSEETAC